MTKETSEERGPIPRKKSWRRSWRAASPLRKVELIVLALGAIAGSLGALAGLGYLVVYVAVSHSQIAATQAEDRPRLIISRPPDLLGVFGCKVTPRALHFAATETRFWM